MPLGSSSDAPVMSPDPRMLSTRDFADSLFCLISPTPSIPQIWNVGVSPLYQTRRCHRCDASETNGTANATRGQALPQLHEIFAGLHQRRLKLLNVSCGTGRFLDFAKQAWPRLPAVGLGMSEAKRHSWVVADQRRRRKRGINSSTGRQPRCGDEHLHVSLRRILFREFARVLSLAGASKHKHIAILNVGRWAPSGSSML